VPELKELRLPTAIVIGAATTFTEVAEDGVIRSYIPVLAEGSLSGRPQVRNTGTVGEHLQRRTDADTAALLLVLEPWCCGPVSRGTVA
jgi:carbon-monoxide dehydrogenase medium subunit